MKLTKGLKSALVILLSLVLAFQLVACSSSSEPAAAEQPAATTDEAPAEEAPTEASSTEGVTINLMADNRAEFDKMLELYPEFEAETGIKLNFTQLEETPLRSKTGLELAAPSTDIDVIMMDFTFVSKFSQAGYLQELDALMEAQDTYNYDDFMASFMDACSYEGNLYAVPINQDCSIMMYRADIFAELGLDVPQTFEELEAVCAEIAAAYPDMAPIVMRGARGAGVNEWTWPTFLWGFGGQYYDENYNAVLNSPEAVESLEYYANILNTYGPQGVANYSYIEAQTDMAQGNAAILIDSATLAVRLEDPESSTIAGKIGYAVVPGNEGMQQPGFYAWTLAIPKNSKNQEAAAKFVAWLASPEIAQQVGWSAPNQALETVYAIPAYADYDQAQSLYDVMMESLAIANPDFRPRIDEGTEISTRVSEAISSVIAGETDAQTALDAANEDVDKILADGGYQS